MFWAVCCVAWSGSFRIHELVSKKETEYDVQSTLLWKDVQKSTVTVDNRDTKVLSFYLKSPKTDRIGNGDRLEIFEVPDSFMCPIRAFEKWEKFSSVKKSKHLPVFRKLGGECFTGTELNKYLYELTGGLRKHNIEIKSHSFRAGVCSILAAQGHSPETIMAIGRWTSEAWKTYAKLPRLQRATMAASICGVD